MPPAHEARKRHGNCRLLERISSDDQSHIKESHFQKSTSKNSRPEESQRAKKNDTHHLLYFPTGVFKICICIVSLLRDEKVIIIANENNREKGEALELLT